MKKRMLTFYLASVFLNAVIPIFLTLTGEKREGEKQLFYLMVFGWAILSLVFYAFYFIIPAFVQRWERYAGIFFPSVLYCILLFWETGLIGIIGANFIWNILLCYFLWRYENKNRTGVV
ncbi:hypothetical protein [Flavobacterium silvaticum]|uniref:Uncharacterized protein n=1 Tax=Flavobacterium silvaticum TaxID=1852020 RepID=A0A972JGG1_9FLAO|nr:hypothetical protein [Flavobacterium silvaticum]NMH29009.1 hypothetical protein [Flavobacterium silvaticum]